MAVPKIGIPQASKIQHMYKQLYPWKSKFGLANYLLDNIIYTSDGVIAINKPYGMGLRNVTEEMINAKISSGGPINRLHVKGSGVTYSLEDVLPIIRDKLKLPQLVSVKSAEKYNTGVTILAENPAAANHIRKSVKLAKSRGRLCSSYCIVSPFTPEQGKDEKLKEKVAIQLQRNSDHKAAQPVIIRDFSVRKVKYHEVKPVQVTSSVISTSRIYQASLVQIDVNEKSNNFLRIYSADRLMPILGDHLYSLRVSMIQGVLTRLNPLHNPPGLHSQHLSQDIKKALQVPMSVDTSIIPLHAHLRTYTLMDYFSRGKHLTITAPFKDYFTWTCEQLKISIPSDPVATD